MQMYYFKHLSKMKSHWFCLNRVQRNQSMDFLTLIPILKIFVKVMNHTFKTDDIFLPYH